MPHDEHREVLTDDEVEAQIRAALPEHDVTSTLPIPDQTDDESLPLYDPEPEEGKATDS